jgi:hypothetical protein
MNLFSSPSVDSDSSEAGFRFFPSALLQCPIFPHQVHCQQPGAVRKSGTIPESAAVQESVLVVPVSEEVDIGEGAGTRFQTRRVDSAAYPA